MQTDTLTIKAIQLTSGIVKAKTGDATDEATYANRYKAMYMPTVSEDSQV